MKFLIPLFFLLLGMLCSLSAGAQNKLNAEPVAPEFALLLSEYIQYSSVSGNEKPAGEFLSALCKEKGLHIRLFSRELDNYNFAASLYPLASGKPNIIFLNHIDVVPPANTSAWRYPPFSGIIADGMVWGRGAIDLKGIAIMQLMAILSLKEHAEIYDLPYNVTLLCVSQEETTSKGARYVVEHHLEELSPLVVFGEGGAGISNLVESNPKQEVFCISTAEKQVLWLRLSLNIHSGGHGAVPPDAYANKIMVKALARLLRKKQPIQFVESNLPMFETLGKIEKGARGVALRNLKILKPFAGSKLRREPKLLALVSNTISLTRIDNPPGGDNQIAQQVSAILDCRLLPETDPEQFVRSVKRSLNNSNIRIDIETQIEASRPTSTSNYLYQGFKQSLTAVFPDAKVMPFLFPAYTDNNFFRSQGIPVYGIKPLSLSNELLESVHNTDERIPIKALEDGIEVYKHFLSNIVLKEQTATIKSNQ
jgi:carboxypeptidase PM20D1